MFHRVAATDDLWPGEMSAVTAGGARVLLVNIDGAVHAYEDRCLHRAVPLSAGRLQRGVLTCAAHEWTYDAASGRGLNPAGIALRRFPVRIDDSGIWVDTGETGGDAPRPNPDPEPGPAR